MSPKGPNISISYSIGLTFAGSKPSPRNISKNMMMMGMLDIRAIQRTAVSSGVVEVFEVVMNLLQII